MTDPLVEKVAEAIARWDFENYTGMEPLSDEVLPPHTKVARDVIATVRAHIAAEIENPDNHTCGDQFYRDGAEAAADIARGDQP